MSYFQKGEILSWVFTEQRSLFLNFNRREGLLFEKQASEPSADNILGLYSVPTFFGIGIVLLVTVFFLVSKGSNK